MNEQNTTPAENIDATIAKISQAQTLDEAMEKAGNHLSKLAVRIVDKATEILSNDKFIEMGEKTMAEVGLPSLVAYVAFSYETAIMVADSRDAADLSFTAKGNPNEVLDIICHAITCPNCSTALTKDDLGEAKEAAFILLTISRLNPGMTHEQFANLHSINPATGGAEKLLSDPAYAGDFLTPTVLCGVVDRLGNVTRMSGIRREDGTVLFAIAKPEHRDAFRVAPEQGESIH